MCTYLHAVYISWYAPGMEGREGVTEVTEGVVFDDDDEEEDVGRVRGLPPKPGQTIPPDPAMACDAWLTAALDDPSIGTHIRE